MIQRRSYHRPPSKRAIAGDRGRERLPGQDAREHPHRCSGIFCVERAPRRFQAAKSGPGDMDAFAPHLDFDPQLAQAFKRAAAIRRQRIVADLAAPLGKRRKNRIAMRNGFIAGQLHNARYVSTGRNNFLRHGAILARTILGPWSRVRSQSPRFILRNCRRPETLVDFNVRGDLGHFTGQANRNALNGVQ